MTLEEAILLLTTWEKDGEVEDSEKLHQAERLGIEALKAVNFTRANNFRLPLGLLPGETED